ncbi:MAG: nucleotidyltransferase [Sulfobacillus benefaciens]|uniref:Nucleotidyltransferase n=1 Tax=Sulfobacillus benefaciens TaxID=453960 RepID=A0A2T2XHF7_9FIRM|nr:MAG: nucleotidyltransferase [Sulfobacillus benefaciens]
MLIDPDGLTALCHRYGIRELALFGSVLRDDFTSQSDVDVLCEMGPKSAIRSLFDVGRLVGDLEELTWRRPTLECHEEHVQRAHSWKR